MHGCIVPNGLKAVPTNSKARCKEVQANKHHTDRFDILTHFHSEPSLLELDSSSKNLGHEKVSNMPVALTLACHLRRSLSSKLAGNVLLCHSRAYSSTEAKVDAVVVGAGVVGLAVGRALALRGVEVIVADPAGNIGAETSSRSSEVIHAGEIR